MILLYLLVLAGANVATAELTPIFTTFMGQTVAITAGTFFIGALFFLRDLVQRKHGVKTAYVVIGVALLLNLALSFYYDDLFWITVASAAALTISEVADTLVYSRFDGDLGPRVLASGAVSTPLDSIVFVVIGLSPLTTGIIPWEAVLATIVLQWLIKFGMQVVVALPLWRVRAVAT
jgi:queuosine precursor transporter